MDTVQQPSSVLYADDDRLRERVISSIARLQLPLHRFVRIEVNQGVVHLRGQVRSYYEKQLAYAISRRVPGVKEVVDRVAVTYPASPNLAVPSVPLDATPLRRAAHAPAAHADFTPPATLVQPKSPHYPRGHVKLGLEEYLSERDWPVAG